MRECWQRCCDCGDAVALHREKSKLQISVGQCMRLPREEEPSAVRHCAGCALSGVCLKQAELHIMYAFVCFSMCFRDIGLPAAGND